MVKKKTKPAAVKKQEPCPRCSKTRIEDPAFNKNDAVLWLVHEDTGLVICEDQHPQKLVKPKPKTKSKPKKKTKKKSKEKENAS